MTTAHGWLPDESGGQDQGGQRERDRHRERIATELDPAADQQRYYTITVYGHHDPIGLTVTRLEPTPTPAPATLRAAGRVAPSAKRNTSRAGSWAQRGRAGHHLYSRPARRPGCASGPHRGCPLRARRPRRPGSTRRAKRPKLPDGRCRPSGDCRQVQIEKEWIDSCDGVNERWTRIARTSGIESRGSRQGRRRHSIPHGESGAVTDGHLVEATSAESVTLARSAGRSLET